MLTSATVTPYDSHWSFDRLQLEAVFALMEIREVKLSDLKPWPRNYRQHPPAQVENIAKSLRQHGQYRNVVVQARTNRIIAGHGVVEAAKSEGRETVLAMLLDVPDAEAQQILVDDNELARGAEDDTEALLELLADLQGTENASYALDDEAIEDMLRSVTVPRMPEEFPEADPDSMALEHVCPKCGYEW